MKLKDKQGKPKYRTFEWLVRVTVKTFRKRADNWEREEGAIGRVVASELRGVIDAFEEVIKSKDK